MQNELKSFSSEFFNENCLFETPFILKQEEKIDFQNHSYELMQNQPSSDSFKINSFNNCNFQNCQVAFNSVPQNQEKSKQKFNKKVKIINNTDNKPNKKRKLSSDESTDSNYSSVEEKKTERRSKYRLYAQATRARHKIELEQLRDCQDSFIDLGERIETCVNLNFLGADKQHLQANIYEKVNYYKKYVPEIIDSILNKKIKNVNDNGIISLEAKIRIDNINYENSLSKRILEARIAQLSLENEELKKKVLLASKKLPILGKGKGT